MRGLRVAEGFFQLGSQRLQRERRAARGGGTNRPTNGDTEGKGDKAAAKNYPADYRERYVLGRALVARGEVERLTTALENAQDHGDKRRFRVWEDSKTRSRWISEFDIKCRADARALRHVYEQEILDRDIRRERR